MSAARLARLTTLSLLLGLGACGGGGGSSGSSGPAAPPPSNDPPAVAPFGLTERASLAAFALPSQVAGGNDFSLVDAYPSLAFDRPIFTAGIPGADRLVVVEQGGLIHAFDDESGADTTRIVLDIQSRVICCGEQGLLGLAFDPDFNQNRFVYVHYTAAGPRSRIARFTWNAGADLIDSGTEKVILEVDQPYSNHNSGMLAFGPDGLLYVGLGDGGSANDPLNSGQDRTTLLGSLLRIDVHPADPGDPYDIPLGNPFVGDPDSRDEIFAYGLRNPWRFSFDRQTGDLLLGDVGQGEIEEIDHIVAGGNYGWRAFEGTQTFDRDSSPLPDSAFTPPVYEYSHALGNSVTGGYVYRGTQLAALFGNYVYADFVSGRVWAFDWDGAQASNNREIASASNPSSFGETTAGELRLVSYNGSVFRFEDDAGGGEIPELLSVTGLFTDLDPLTPAGGLVEYDVRHPFYSDGAQKRRWVGVPDAATIDFGEDDWTFPIGTVVVKHFGMDMDESESGALLRLETRVLLHTTDGWLGFTYRWNSDQTDAVLLSGRETETLAIRTGSGGTREQLYEYPSRTDCLACHTQAGSVTLGLKTPQLNRDFDYTGTTDNQLRSWNNIDLFDRDIGAASQYDQFVTPSDATASLETRARTYLDVNCSQCHRAGGPTGTDLDLRLEATSLNAIDVAPAAGDLGLADARIIAAGERERSVLWARMQRLDGERMPPLGSHRIDDTGAAVVGDWIDSL